MTQQGNVLHVASCVKKNAARKITSPKLPLLQPKKQQGKYTQRKTVTVNLKKNPPMNDKQ